MAKNLKYYLTRIRGQEFIPASYSDEQLIEDIVRRYYEDNVGWDDEMEKKYAGVERATPRILEKGGM